MLIGYLANTYNTAAGYNSGETAAVNNLGNTDPLLNSDFTLQSNASPCYQNGVAGTGISFDISGQNYRTPPSIGAFEYY